MMMDSVGKAMDEAVTQTFESAAFIDVEKIKDKPEYSEDQILHCKIDINSPLKGIMTIVASKELIEEVGKVAFADMLEEQEAQNMDENTSDNSLQDKPIKPLFDDDAMFDILNELLNTLAGNLLKHIVSEDQVFTIGFPETKQGEPSNFQDEDWHIYLANNQLFAAHVVLS